MFQIKASTTALKPSDSVNVIAHQPALCRTKPGPVLQQTHLYSTQRCVCPQDVLLPWRCSATPYIAMETEK